MPGYGETMRFRVPQKYVFFKGFEGSPVADEALRFVEFVLDDADEWDFYPVSPQNTARCVELRRSSVHDEQPR